MVAFEESKTRINLMRAFAGESQARNRYTFAAEQAREQGLNVVGEVFDFTAAQEKTHAEVFYRLLTPLNGLNILMDAGFPVNTGKTAAEQLRMAAHNEMEESRVVYPDFARTARDEGFAAIGDTFERIAAIEASHAERFTRMADALETGKLFAPGWGNHLDVPQLRLSALRKGSAEGLPRVQPWSGLHDSGKFRTFYTQKMMGKCKKPWSTS